MTNTSELLADRLEAGSALYDPQDRKLAVAALRAFGSPPSDVDISKIGRDSANRIMALRHTPPSDVGGRSEGPVAWRWRNILGNYDLWSYGADKPDEHPQYITEPLYVADFREAADPDCNSIFASESDVGRSDMAMLADEIDAALNLFLCANNSATRPIEEKALAQILWDNKAGIVAALRQSTPSPGDAPKSADERAIVFWYKNYKGKQGYRRVVPISIRYGTSDYHTSPQWLMLAFDTEKNAEREFAMSDMSHNVLGTPIVLHPATPSPSMWCRACGTVSSDGTCDCSHFGLNHLRDAVPEHGQQDEREAIARIIEPSTFPANVPDCSCPVCRPWLGVQETALEKADAILALLSRSPAPGNEVAQAVPSAAQLSALDDASNACLELAAQHGFATGHGDTVADMIREFSGQIRHAVPKQAPGNGSAMREALEEIEAICNYLRRNDPAVFNMEDETNKLRQAVRRAKTALTAVEQAPGVGLERAAVIEECAGEIECTDWSIPLKNIPEFDEYGKQIALRILEQAARQVRALLAQPEQESAPASVGVLR